MFRFKKSPKLTGKKHEVVFYSKGGCPLCDEAREALQNVAKKFALDIREIDITTDSAIFERYKNIIPVVVIDGKFTFGARVSEDDIIACLKEIKDSRQ